MKAIEEAMNDNTTVATAAAAKTPQQSLAPFRIFNKTAFRSYSNYTTTMRMHPSREEEARAPAILKRRQQCPQDNCSEIFCLEAQVRDVPRMGPAKPTNVWPALLSQEQSDVFCGWSRMV